MLTTTYVLGTLVLGNLSPLCPSETEWSNSWCFYVTTICINFSEHIDSTFLPFLLLTQYGGNQWNIACNNTVSVQNYQYLYVRNAFEAQYCNTFTYKLLVLLYSTAVRIVVDYANLVLVRNNVESLVHLTYNYWLTNWLVLLQADPFWNYSQEGRKALQGSYLWRVQLHHNFITLWTGWIVS